MALRFQETRPSIEEVCAKALHLPCSPAILPRLAAALQSDVTSAAQIERLISLDTSLAAATLRLANAPMHGPCAVDTLEVAILRLGAKEIYRLAALVLVGRWSVGVADADRSSLEFSRHALLTAVAAEVLAETTALVDADLAYTAGLVSEVGRLALVLSCASFLPMIRTHCQLRRSSWKEAEKSVLGFDHAEVGGRLLTAWRFPAVLAAAAHHLTAPYQASSEVGAVVAHVHAARFLAARIDGQAGDGEFAGPWHTAFLAEWDLSADKILALAPQVSERVSERWGGRLVDEILQPPWRPIAVA